MKWIAQNKLLFIGLVVLVLGGAWYVLSNDAAPEADLLTSVSTASDSPTQENADQQLVATLLALRSVSLVGAIFQDPAFTSLRDFGTAIIAEPQGRQNPFAPLTSTPSAPPSSTGAAPSPTTPSGGAAR
jgi:hypothetical protein